MPTKFLALILFAAPLLSTLGGAAPWGGTIPDNLGVRLKGPDMNAETLDQVRALGLKWVRRGCVWEGIEKEPRDFVLRFTNSKGGVKLAAWTAPPAIQGPDRISPHTISIPLEAGEPLTFHDLYGKESTLGERRLASS